MNRSIRILVGAGTLLSLLTFTVPAHAAGWAHNAPETGVLQATWEWITGLWMAGNPVQGQRHGQRETGSTSSLSKSDKCAGIDPDGKPNAGASCTTG